MRPHWSYWMWTTGTYQVTHSIALNWRRRYLVTGYLTQTDGDDYAHVYISMVCHYGGGDVRRCGIRDFSDDKFIGIVEFISGADLVTVKLKTKGGSHRAEGIVYEIQ